MWIDDDLIFPMEETFGDICKRESPFPDIYLFYETSLRTKFEEKFKQHFKYYQIGYPNLDMFKDHFKDILDLNYPKYKHYWDTLEKARTLKWWNNKDFVTTFERTLNTSDVKNFTTNLERLEAVIKTLDKTGTVDDKYSRELKEQTTENLKNDVVNDLRKSGSNKKTLEKGTTITTDFERNLGATDNITVNDTKETKTSSQNSSENITKGKNDTETQSDSLSKHLDTPQGAIANLTRDMDNYMSSGDQTEDSEIVHNTTDNTSQTAGRSNDQTNTLDKKIHQEIETETGTTKNVESSKGTDTTTDTLGERHNTVITDKKDNLTILMKTGNAKDTKEYNTRDTTNRDLTGTDTTEGTEENKGRDDESYRKVEEGNIGVTSAGQLVNDWLKYGYINIDKMIIRDCEKLFLQVY